MGYLNLFQGCLVNSINISSYLFSRTTNALFADLADIFVACFVGFACFIALFWKLHHDEFAVSAVLSVELHNGVGGGGRAREEVEDMYALPVGCFPA
ncbi:MAG: hypothetical protein U0N50_08540 [Christensenellales bacterium]